MDQAHFSDEHPQCKFRTPIPTRPAQAGVVQRPRTPKPARQPFLGAHIVTWEHVQAAEAFEQHVLGRPPADAAQFAQLLPDHIVVFTRGRLEIRFLLHDCTGEAKKRADFLAAEPERPVPLGRQSRHVARRGKGVAGVALRSKSRAAGRRESIE